MKKIMLLLSLLNLSLFAQQYYYSNSIAMELEPILDVESFILEQSEWILEKFEQYDRTESILFHFGVEKKRIIETSVNFTEYIEGLLSEDTKLGDKGQITERVLYNSEGSPIEKEIYNYNTSGDLISIDRRDIDEKTVFSQKYKIRSDGSLRAITYSFGEDDKSRGNDSWNTHKGSFYMEEHNDARKRQVLFYNGSNNLEKVLRYEEDILVYEEIFDYDQDGFVSKIVKKDFHRSESTILIMNEKGQLIREDFFVDDKMKFNVSYLYSDSHLIQKDKIGSGIKEKWLYDYRDNERVTEEFYKQGVLQQKKTNMDSADNSYVIELYDRGLHFMNLVFKKDVKIREEYISEGQVIRVRELGD